MKFISTLLLAALCSCSAFSDTPDTVLEGQRGIYRATSILQQNYEDLLSKYERDVKAMVVYHNNYVYERLIVEIENNDEFSEEFKQESIASLELERDLKIEQGLNQIDTIVRDFRVTPLRNFEITLLLTETVYNYLSTSPIKFDDINYWIKELDEATADDR